MADGDDLDRLFHIHKDAAVLELHMSSGTAVRIMGILLEKTPAGMRIK